MEKFSASSLNVDGMAAEVYDVTFRWLRLPRKNISAEHNKNYCEVSTKQEEFDDSLNVDCAAVELNDPTFRRPRLPRRNAPDVRDEKNDIDDRVFHRTSLPLNEPPGGRNDDYIWLTSESNQSVCARPVTGSLCSGQPHGLLSFYFLESVTLTPNCHCQQIAVCITPDSCCSHHTWCIEVYAIRSSITVILRVWYCVGVLRLRAMASDDSADREESGPLYAPSGPLPGTFLGPALDIRSERLYELAPELQLQK